MAYNFKEEMSKPERLSGGHRLCAGCGASIAVRGVLRALDADEKRLSPAPPDAWRYPPHVSHTSWNDSFIHAAFENSGATCSGVESAYRALTQRGKLNEI